MLESSHVTSTIIGYIKHGEELYTTRGMSFSCHGCSWR